MSRLIDADALIEQLREADRKYSNDIIKACIGLVQTQPTAYDVEKVVAELEEAKGEISLYGDDLDFYCNGLDEAIEIVRKGGVE